MVAAAFSKSCRDKKECMDMSKMQTVQKYMQKLNDILDIVIITCAVLFLVLKLLQRKQCRNRSQEET